MVDEVETEYEDFEANTHFCLKSYRQIFFVLIRAFDFFGGWGLH